VSTTDHEFPQKIEMALQAAGLVKRKAKRGCIAGGVSAVLCQG
jgi:hypothetical protein